MTNLQHDGAPPSSANENAFALRTIEEALAEEYAEALAEEYAIGARARHATAAHADDRRPLPDDSARDAFSAMVRAYLAKNSRRESIERERGRERRLELLVGHFRSKQLPDFARSAQRTVAIGGASRTLVV